MRICSVQNNPNFEARVRLKDTGKLFNCSVNGSSKLDVMFNENAAVKELAQFSVFIKRKIIAKYFNDEDSTFQQLGVKFCHKLLKLSRVLADKIFFINNKDAIENFNESIIKMPLESKEYIEELARVGNSIDSKYININDVNNPLEELSKSDEANIFVLNHPNYHKDKFVYLIINSILNKMYVNQGLQANCPRPKVLVSRNMLKIICSENGNIYKHLGLTEVDASLDNRDIYANASSMKQLLKDFVNNKSNIFIFPEGNNSVFQEKRLAERMQSGVAEFIKMASSMKKNVRVVPVGIFYSKEKDSLGNIFIGEPIIYKKNGKFGLEIKNSIFTQNIEGKRNVKEILNSVATALENAVGQAKNV